MNYMLPILNILLFCTFGLFPLQASASTPYIRGWAGATWLHDTIKDTDVDYDIGIATGIAFGYNWPYCLKTEVEALYFHNDISQITVNSYKTGLQGGIDTYAAMFNGIFEYPLTFDYITVSPYLGAGLGASYEVTHLSAKGLSKHKDRERRFAYQFETGLTFPFCLKCINADAAVNLEARYLVFDEHVRALMAIGGFSVRF